MAGMVLGAVSCGQGGAVCLFGTPLVGISAANGDKFGLTIILFLVLALLRALAGRLTTRFLRDQRQTRVRFWTRQSLNVIVAALAIFGVLSIWFNDPTRLATAIGLVSAGLAFALQRVVTSFAGYIVILRGRTFNVGDRITMGGVRGDVIALGFIQTTILEMGEPPAVQSADPATWVRSRQYTGRIVTVTNDSIFNNPVYNYTRDFPFLWEEMPIPIPYDADRDEAERILLDCAGRHTFKAQELGDEALASLRTKYALTVEDFSPRVYYRITDNWLELTVRFVVFDHGVRDVKDTMSRDILRGFDAAGIGIASATYDIVGLPPVRLRSDPDRNGNRPTGAQPQPASL